MFPYIYVYGFMCVFIYDVCTRKETRRTQTSTLKSLYVFTSFFEEHLPPYCCVYRMYA